MTTLLLKTLSLIRQIYLTEYLLLNYGKDERATRILNSTEIYIVPTVNPDGYEKAVEGCSIFSRS